MREFTTGATRDTDEGKLDYFGFLSPYALRSYAEYMNSHRQQADGKLRDSDNWKKGIPIDAYQRSGFRHMMEWKEAVESGDTPKGIELANAILFNVFGWLHEHTKPGPQFQIPKANEATEALKTLNRVSREAMDRIHGVGTRPAEYPDTIDPINKLAGLWAAGGSAMDIADALVEFKEQILEEAEPLAEAIGTEEMPDYSPEPEEKSRFTMLSERVHGPNPGAILGFGI